MLAAAAVLAALVAAPGDLEALPERLRHPPGGPLIVTPLQIDPSDARAHLRLARLTPSEQEELWRRRAVVHAVLQRWDDALGFSRSDEWRRINGWRSKPLNVFPDAYSRREGMTSASADLVTFAEEFFVPPEAVHPGAVPRDDQVPCQELSKSRVLLKLLDQARFLTDEDRARFGRGACPAFDAWASPQTLSHAEVLLVAASGRAPESLFGHVLLRLARKEDALVQGPSFDTAVQLVALTGADKPDVRYLWRGLTGGYALSVMTAPWGDIAHQTLQAEQRSVRRFRLKLSSEEEERLLERIWELERRGYFEYWFFTDNCAALLAFVLQGVLDEGRLVKLPPPHAPVLPAAVVDALIAAGVAVPEPGTFESLRDRAVRAERDRQEREEVLRANADPAIAAELARALSRASDPRVEVRRTGWARMAALTDRLPARESLYAWWIDTVRIERFELERAEAARRQALLESLDREVVHFADADATVAQRQAEFRHEDGLQRRLAALDRMGLAEAQLEHAPRLPLTASQSEAVDRALALAAAFRELTGRHARVVDRVFANQDAEAFLRGEDALRASQEQTWAASALQRSGYARFALGPAAVSNGPGLLVYSAALDEELGDQRVSGFRSSSRLQVLSGRAWWTRRAGWPSLQRSDLTLLGYRTLERELAPFRSAPWDALGWGFDWTYDRDAGRAEPDRSAMSLQAFAVLNAAPDFRSFTAVGLGAYGQLGWSDLRRRWRFGPEVLFTQRVPLGSALARCARWEVRVRPGFDLRAEASLDVPARLGGRAFLIRPALSVQWERGAGRADAAVLFEPL